MEQAERDRLRAWLRPSPSIPLGKSVPLAHWNMFSAGRVHFSFKTPSFRQIISHLAYLNQMQVPFLTRKFPFFFLAQPTVKVVNSGKSFVMKCESCYPVCFAHAPPLLPVANKTWAFCLERWKEDVACAEGCCWYTPKCESPFGGQLQGHAACRVLCASGKQVWKLVL